MNDELSLSLSTCDVAFGSDILFFRQSDEANSAIVRQYGCNRHAAVIYDDKFQIGIILSQEVARGLWHKTVPIARRHDTRNKWRRILGRHHCDDRSCRRD